MPLPGTIIGQITEELGDLGKKVVTETAKVPGDVAGVALESLTRTSGTTRQGSQTAGGKPAGETPFDAFAKAKDEESKRRIARAALEYLAGVCSKPKKLSVWEEVQMEVEEKRQQKIQQQVQAAKRVLPETGSKRPRGDLYGIRSKRAAAETGRNVRQD